MSTIVPGKVIDLAGRNQVALTSERVIRQAGINIDAGSIPQCPGEHIITVVSLNSGEAWHIPADARLLVTLRNRLEQIISGAENPTPPTRELPRVN